MGKTLIVLNPHAGGGRAGKLWSQIEPILWETLGELVIAVTEHPEEVAKHLDKAYEAGLTRVVSIGGDGTNHALVNALADLNQQHPEGPVMVYGMLPIGTGRDWARSQGIPFDIKEAARWIAEAQPHPTDIGLLQSDRDHEHFLNIASVGLGGEVDRRVNRVQRRRPWTFLKATVQTILTYKAQPMHIRVDGETWYDRKALVTVIANGTTFGHGMQIAPGARTDDGLFDVIVIEEASRLTLLRALRRVYDGSHLTHPAVHFCRGREVNISGGGQPLMIDLDGEYAEGAELTFSVKPGLLHLLT
jgi:YegS/Rv2252/BmrU family lipid kinase